MSGHGCSIGNAVGGQSSCCCLRFFLIGPQPETTVSRDYQGTCAQGFNLIWLVVKRRLHVLAFNEKWEKFHCPEGIPHLNLGGTEMLLKQLVVSSTPAAWPHALSHRVALLESTSAHCAQDTGPPRKRGKAQSDSVWLL